MFEEIDAKVRDLINNVDVKYQAHIGGGYYVSVTTGFRCVDLRKWFMPWGEKDPKPTKQGISLRLNEWSQMRHLIDKINIDHHVLGIALPCFMQDDHMNQLGAFECHECNPFFHLI